MPGFVAFVTDRNKPVNWFFPYAFPSISFMMNLSSWSTTIYTAPIISCEYNISFPFPCIRLKIFIPIVISAAFSLLFKQPMLTKPRDYPEYCEKNYI